MEREDLINIIQKKINKIIADKNKYLMKSIVRVLLEDNCQFTSKKDSFLFVLDKLENKTLIKLIALI